MANGISTEIVVKRTVRDDWFVYTCDELPGLLVAGKDDKVAYDDLPLSIRALLKLDHGRDFTVAHKLSYAEFFTKINLSARARAAVKDHTADLMSDVALMIPFTVQTNSQGIAH